MAVDTEEQPIDTGAMDEAAFNEAAEEAFLSTERPTNAANPVATQVIEKAAELEPSKAEPTQEPVTPEFAQIPLSEWQEMVKLKQMVGKLDQGFGTLGQLQQVIKEMQSRTPAGQAVEVSDEDLAEMKAEFPELAEMQKKAWNRVVSRMGVTGTAAPAPELDMDGIVRTVTKRLAIQRLERDHKDWDTIRTSEAWDKWLDTQPHEFVNRVRSSVDPDFISTELTRYKDETTPKADKKPAPKDTKPSDRTARLTGAVVPRGVTPAGNASHDDDNGFSSAWDGEAKKIGLGLMR